MAYPTPESSRERTTSYPVIRLFAEKVPHKSPFAIVFKVHYSYYHAHNYSENYHNNNYEEIVCPQL